MITICLGGCAPEQIDYAHFEHIANDTWLHDMPLRFTPQWSDSTAQHQLLVTVRHTQHYPHGNLPMVVDLIGADGHVKRHRLNMRITDGHGNWVGKGFGTLYQCQATVSRDVTSIDAQRVVVWLNLDSCQSVTGVTDIGITLIKN